MKSPKITTSNQLVLKIEYNFEMLFMFLHLLCLAENGFKEFLE